MSGIPPLEALVAREEIRRLPLRYAKAVEQRDVEAMVELFVPDARFGPFGEGPDALRAMMTDFLADSIVAVILVANHLVELDDADHAHGEVWARCFAQDATAYTEQLLRYDDRYERRDGVWRFVHRRHRLWFGRRTDSPFDQDAADWPAAQHGVGDVPLADERFRAWWEDRRS